MLSVETERKLVQIFVSISLGEDKINKLKQDIFQQMTVSYINLI